jgi:hypothetical protein
MSGAFLSYARADRALAEQIIHALRAVGIDVWWDEDMPGVDWQEELERQISSLAAVVVLWTPNSLASKNVRDEARLGLRTDKLVNVLAGASEPPFPFDRVNGLPLDGWTGREPHRGWGRVVQTIEALIVRAGSVQPGEITAPGASVATPASGAPALAVTPASAPAKLGARLVLAAVLLLVALVGAFLLLFHRHTSGASGATAAAASAAPQATPNPAINGKWTLQNASCADALQIAIGGGTITFGANRMKIASVDVDGTVNAGPDDNRYNYEVSGDTLTVTAPDAEQKTYIRCAG